MKRAGQKGGRHVKKPEEKWQKETYSFKVFYKEIEACQLHHVKKPEEKWQKETYSFKVFYNEIEACQLHQENRVLRGQKRKLEASLADEQTKRLKVE